MNVDQELSDYNAAGALAEEIPYWGWLEDGRTCLTRSGELVSIARLSPAVLDGRTPEQMDAVLERWQRMLSGADSRTRIYFYLFRRAPRFDPGELGEQSTVAAISQRRRRSFLSSRVQDIQTYIAWTYDPHLSSASKGRSNQAWWKSYLQNWLARRRNPHESVYLLTEIEAAATRFRQLVDASRALVSDLTPVEVLDAKAGSGVLSELINRPGRPGEGWEGATGRGMNWRLARSELEAERRYLRLDGESVILYSLLSPPGGARANLLNDLYRLDATMTVAMEWRPWGLDSARRKIRGAQRHYFSKRYSMMAHMQETEGTSSAMVDSAADAESSRLGNALVELETEGIAYGDLALTISLHGDLEQTERLDGDIHRIFASHDAKAIREGYGQLATWFCRLPAQPRKRQVRSVFVSAGAAACLAPLFGPPSGNPRSAHLRRDALAILETQWKTPYYYDLFHGDVGHTLIPGGDRRGQELHVELSACASPAVRSPRSDSRLGRLLPLADPLSGRRLSGTLPRRRRRQRRLPVTAFLAAGRRADLSIPNGMDHTPAPHRRLAGERGRPQRNPRPHRGPVRVRAGAPHLGGAGQELALQDVARAGALARRGRLGKILRQPGWRAGP